jgi:uncharacterized protein with PIN domain
VQPELTIILFTNIISTIWKFKAARADREIKLLVNRCDICNNRITGAQDDLESQIDILKETSDIPRLVLCDSCRSEYLIPSWVNVTNSSRSASY